MNYEAILIIVSLGSFLVVAAMFFRKAQVLAELSEVREGRVKDGLLSRIKDRIKNSHRFQSFSFEIFLQKILSKIRILTLKTESKTSNLLQKLRENAQKKNGGGENYWEDLKNSAKKEKK